LNPKYVTEIKHKVPPPLSKINQDMNIKLFSTRLLPLMACFFSFAMSGLFAQGFVRKIPYNSTFGGGSESVFAHADGTYRLTASQFPDFGTHVTLNWFDINAQGELVGSQQMYIPLYIVDTNIIISIHSEESFFQLDNGDFLNFGSDSNSVVVSYIEVDATATPQQSIKWTTKVPIDGYSGIGSLVFTLNNAGDVFVNGYASIQNPSTSTYQFTGYVLKLEADGTFLWKSNFPITVTYITPKNFVATPDGGCVLGNFDALGESSLKKFDANGQQEWSYSSINGELQSFSTSSFNKAIASNGNSELFFPVWHKQINDHDTLYVEKISANGTLLTSVNIQNVLGIQNGPNVDPQFIFSLADGGFAVIVERYLLNSWETKIVRVRADGSIAWSKSLNFLPDYANSFIEDGMELPNGDLILYGSQNDLYFVKMSADGQIYPNTLMGKVVRDSTFNCIADASDPILENWVVSATVNGLTQYASSDANGNYVINDLDNGACKVVLTTQNYLWNPCVDSVSLNLNSTIPQTDTIDFAVQALYDCPVMQVDISTPGLRRCFPNTYHVRYCNSGNQTANPTFIGVQLDALLRFDSASVPFTQNGNEYLFDVGAVTPGECGSFVIYTYLDCAAELGQTLCATAHIWPDTLCAQNLPNWSGAQVEVSAVCEGDSVRFTIKNTGLAANSQSLDFVIVDDHVITRLGNFNLPAGGVKTETVLADGSTWRLAAEQEPGFPFGSSMPSVAVEGCSTIGGNISLGMVNLFPNYSGDPFEDTHCQTVVGSFDPNDKAAFPEGVDNEHFIEQNQPIDYKIRFQNTGTDTAFTVVVRDTLDAWLDPASVRLGASSHPYTYTLSGEGILIFTFHPIALPDSNVNEAASHGFLQFKVAQKRDVPLGSRIENRAGIYFDFNAPVMTNTVFHTIGHDFLLINTVSVAPLPVLQIWPNPASDQTTIFVKQQNFVGKTLVMRDVTGRLVAQMPVNQANMVIKRNGLPSGVYFVEMMEWNKVLAVGKVIWE
jgi:uncharacterized repeat protein (TIGR01451 family)